MKNADRRDRPANMVAYRRALSGMTQQELSIKSGVKLSTLQKLESGANSILGAKADTVLYLARALGCSMEDLLE